MQFQPIHKLLHQQRSQGVVETHLGPNGLIRHREEGCLKLRLPHGGQEAILINTSGGLAGGDQISTRISVAEGANFSITSQAAERVYQTLCPPAIVENQFNVAAGASFCWLPQETIMFNGASLTRKMDVHLATGASFLAVESIVLGRTAMDENLTQIEFGDQWNVWQNEKLIHAERMKLSGSPAQSMATLDGAKAFATVLLVSEQGEQKLSILQKVLRGQQSVSCWNGKLIARLVAEDGFQLRNTLKLVLSACLDGRALPRNWEM